jgi:hypothetical protein
LKILENIKTLSEFKERALSIAQQFDIKNILPMYEDLYKQALTIKL